MSLIWSNKSTYTAKYKTESRKSTATKCFPFCVARNVDGKSPYRWIDRWHASMKTIKSKERMGMLYGLLRLISSVQMCSVCLPDGEKRRKWTIETQRNAWFDGWVSCVCHELTLTKTTLTIRTLLTEHSSNFQAC
jgi:hypothetical protein